MTEILQGKWPLSAAQKGIWLGQQLDPESPTYNTAECLDITGPLDPVVFERSLRQTVAEAETLNLRFDTQDGEPIQYVDFSLDWSLQYLDFSSQDHPIPAAWDWMRQELKQTIDLHSEKPFAQALIRVAPEHHFWYQRIHHAVIDGYGFSLLSRRVAEIYTAAIGGKSIPKCPFGSLQRVLEEDFAYQTSQQKQRDRDYWLHVMAMLGEPASLSGSTAPTSTFCQRQSDVLASESFDRLQTVARKMEASWPDLLLATTAVYLHRVTGATDSILGLPMMGRLGTAALRVPAMVMNIVPLRVLVHPGMHFSDLVAQIGKHVREMRPHYRYRYEELRRDLKRVGGGRRLFGPIVNIMPFDSALNFGNASGIVRNISAGPVEDLAVNVRAKANTRELKIDFDGNSACYAQQDLAQHQQQWLAELYASLDNPDRAIASTTSATPEPATSTGHILRGDSLQAPFPSVLDKFIEQARLRPDAEAVVAGDTCWSYSELLERARYLALKLVAAGVQPEQIVALHLPRSGDAIAAILGILFAGAAYLALDPEAPTARNASILQDAQPAFLLAKNDGELPSIPDLPPLFFLDGCDRLPTADTLPSVPENALAYVVYTSGSTGNPKGVTIERSALASFTSGALQQYGIGAGDRVLQFAALHFDASVEEIFCSLCSGATLVLREESMLQSVPRFLRACEQKQITILDLPTAFWHELAFSLANHQASLPNSLRTVIIGGEAAHPERVNQWHDAVGDRVTLLNTYGPSETTVVATAATLEPGCADGGEVPIGRPLPGVDVAVLDSAGNFVPPTEQGELYILGPTLARGYWHRDRLTAERFVRLEHLPGQPRAYRTGDRVFVRGDGQLVFVGRLDDEFKISGHRIDPAEVEAVLAGFEGIREAAVVGYPLAEGMKRLCAYLVTEQPHPSVRCLRQYLAESLPAAAIPAGFNFVDSLPKTSSGKVDRSALRNRSPEWLTEVAGASISPLEATILQIWETILGQQGMTVQDDFFEWGGQSLQTIQVANWLGAKLGCEIEIATLFRYPTAAELARALSSQADIDVGHLDKGTSSAEPNVSETLLAPLFPIAKGQQPPLFCIHPAAGLAWCYMGLAKHLDSEHTLYGIQSPYLEMGVPASEESWDSIVEKYIALVRQVQPQGPYRLLGWSFGGAIAQAMATRLQQHRIEVEPLILLDAYPSYILKRRDRPHRQEVLALLLQATGQAFSNPNQIPQNTEEILTQLSQGHLGSYLDRARLNTLLEITEYNMDWARQMPTPHRYDGDLIFFTAQRGRTDPELHHQAWQPFVSGSIENYDLDAEHGQLLTGDCLQTIARAIAECLTD